MGYKCYIAHNSEGALECYLDKYHDLVIIDNRNNKNFDAEALCRSMRATKASEHSVIVAITKKLPPEKDEPSFLPLLKAGFNRKITENINAHACLNELISLEHGEVRSQLKLRACSALFSALDKVSDAVEITNEDHEIQYWEGTYYTRRKSGDTLGCHCHISPVPGPGGRISHIVTIKNSSHDPTHTERSKETDFTLANGSGILHGIPRRKESLAKIHSMTIEAPITKVINIINAAQESSPITVVQALDKVLEILRTSELYSPYFQTMREDDPMTTDLVGGLVSQKMKKELSTTSQDVNSNSSVKSGHHSHTHIPISPINSLTQVSTNVQKILNTEPSWDFNIIELEVATNKRPLVYLGLKTMARFGVCEFLQTDELTLMNWLALIEANYHAVNPYHNSTHAADVLQASAYFLKCERNKMVLDHADQVACLIAAVIHDVDHPGRSNAFLINERNPLAVLYNDTAVLENHHAALGFQLSWKDDKVSIFKNLNRDEYSSLRENIIDMVLATEMKQHFEHLNKFVNSVNKSTLKMEDTSSMSGNGSPDSMSIMTQLCTPEIRKLIKRMLIKCADVSNPCRQLDLCKIWAIRIAEEYFQQTDDEKQRGLPVVMAVFDRKTCSIPNSQTRFIDVFINDMFDAWDYYCDISELITHLQNNYRYWKEKEEDGIKT
ncbi:hypothetical protein FSP39_013823 [Pinctada imbricata]|uniref:Phosphodiesterase n=1 Tax=Pinctada imbricata TaxID=66713 RepID=A0AA88YEE8_PINIB|nr:hypothetical protein FSP39_013823 [Pinctada imbricata]